MMKGIVVFGRKTNLSLDAWSRRTI